MVLFSKRWTLAILSVCMLSFAISDAFIAGNFRDNNINDDDDDTSKAIEDKGKSIDKISSVIEHSTDNMEDKIEEAGKAIDSPEAEKRIEIAGKGVDELAAEMEEKTEKEGEMIENSMKTVGTDNEKELEVTKNENGENETGNKHEEVHSKPKSNKVMEYNRFETQEKLRQKMEDLVEIQGHKVEEIGNEIEKSRRNKIQHDARKDILKLKRKMERSKRRKKSKQHGIKNKYEKLKTKFVNKKAEKRRVIIPVNKKKLEKIMLYYYVQDKMKDGELNMQNLWKFFDKIKQLPLEEEKPERASFDLSNFVKATRDHEGRTEDENTKEGSKLHSLDNFKDLLQNFIKFHDKKEETESKEKENGKNIDSLINYLESTGVTRGNTPVGTAEEDEIDKEKLKNFMDEKSPEQSKNEKDEKNNEVITVDQVRNMLEKIKNINETIFAMEKKKNEEVKEESYKHCKEEKCVGRALISMLDDALRAVTQAKSSDQDKNAVSSRSKEKKVTGIARSKSDPYAGIGFAESSEKTGEGDENQQDVAGSGRHLTSHGIDVIGTSHPVGLLSERAHMRYLHHDDDDDDNDDDDDDDDDDHYFHHGSYFPLPMHQQMHHVHHHMHHVLHDINDHYDDSHHGNYGGFMGYHGHTMPIRTNHHHDYYGSVEPLNVDTAPMGHYPSRHVHDHLDVDTILRGHPYNYHQPTPDIALEGPISTAPVYEDMHHILNGPGIHDQPDVHYEVEMHAHPYHHEDHHEYGEHDGDRGYHHYHHHHHRDEDIHGDKKHLIEEAKKKVNWGKNTTSKPSRSKKRQLLQEKYKTPTRQRRNEDDENDDDDDDDVEVEKVPRNGHGVARLSYLTQKNGEEMTHAISDGIMDVENVGRSIEENVQQGVDRVTEISNHEVEAPDYDTEGYMQPSIHREDIAQEDNDYKKDNIKTNKI